MKPKENNLPPPPKDSLPLGSYSTTAKGKTGIAGLLQRDRRWVEKHLDPLIKKHPEWKQKCQGSTHRTFYYTIDCITELRKISELEGRTVTEKDLPPPPKNSMRAGNYYKGTGKGSGVAGVVKREINWIHRESDEILKDHPDWRVRCAGSNGPAEYYTIQLIDELKKRADLEDEGDIIGQIETEDRENARKFIQEIADGKTPLAKEIREIIKNFSASRCLDLLFKYRPDFREINVEYIHSLLGKYLGDFLVTRASFNPEAIKKMPPGLLTEKKFYDDFYEVTKDDCLRYYFAKRREAKDMKPIDIIYEYINHKTAILGEFRSKEVDDVIEAVISYYDSALRDFKKPEKFVDSLTTDREFPDINQKVNMKELADKKRLLIADEMGLGKSASVIMAKEHMGVGCALITAPLNVIETWKKYLSSTDNGGYFKTGQEPRVLEVTKPEDLENISPGSYDYIIIPHSKLKQPYVEYLGSLPFDMLIVDESHLLKNLKGKRNEHLQTLAAKVQGENQYLALLSGTPVPNKVQDLAIILKLLHPGKFKDMGNKQLTRQIINGKIHNLRDLLIPHMQMKSLEESVDMPSITRTEKIVELSEAEKDLSRVIMEDDELTSMEKIKLLRQLALNPRIAEATPDIKGSKASAANESIKTAFESKNRVVLFVNDYVGGVIRGEITIMDQFDLSPDIKILVIHGDGVSVEDKVRFQSQFNAKTTEKILLIVSGKTADVGVDFTGGEEIIFYNEPWTKYQKNQEEGRVFRPGLEHDLNIKTLIARGTIEEGIHEYIEKKFIAIEKLLRGVDNSEYEKRLLAADEKNPGTLERNSELAEYFLSSMEKLRKMFGLTFQMGEDKIARFVTEFGQEYAQGYTDMGHRNHEANVNRMVGVLIDRFVSHNKQLPEDIRILDLASGPGMLKAHIADNYQKRVVSMDINRHHFNDIDTNVVVGGMAHIPFRDKSFEYVTSSLAWQDTTFIPGQRNFERIRVLHEANRVLKPNGRLVIALPYRLELCDPDKFSEAVNHLGFEVIPDYTGMAEQGNHFATRVIALEKVADCETDLEKVVEQIGSGKMAGFKFESTTKQIRNPKKIITDFTIAQEIIDVELNTNDQAIKKLEDKYVADGLLLKNKFSGIEHIPEDELIKFGFVRYRRKKSYGLFKKMPQQNGYILIG